MTNFIKTQQKLANSLLETYVMGKCLAMRGCEATLWLSENIPNFLEVICKSERPINEELFDYRRELFCDFTWLV